MESIGVRELRQHASRWLARVQAGETFQVTDRGRPVAALGPLPGTDWDRLLGSGAVRRAETSLDDVEPLAGASLTALLIADRDDER